jgi:small GTP-binding protein
MAGAGDPLIGTRLLDRYEIQERLGAGGMGVVYRARQLDLDRAVAIKLLGPRGSANADWHARLRAEAQALARLQHPNTVRVYELGVFDDAPFIAMELLGGRTLAQELERHGPLPALRALKILLQLCNSLDEAHRAGIVHGDVKPQNVFLLDFEGSTDFVKLVDFSVARLSWAESGAERDMGTPAYMSPEWLAGGTVETTADVYSCGVVAFEMVTGRLPTASRSETIAALLGRAPDRVVAIVLRAMEALPGVRYASVADLRLDIERDLFPKIAVEPGAGTQRERTARPRHASVDPPPGFRSRLTERLHWPIRLVWSSDGRWLAITQDKQLHLIELETGRMSTFPLGILLRSGVRGDSIESVAWLADSHHLAIAIGSASASAAGRPDYAATVLARPERDRSGSTSLRIVRSVAQESLQPFACSPDGTSVAAAKGSTVSILDAKTWATRVAFDLTHKIINLAWHPRGDLLAAGLRGEVAAVLDVPAGVVVRRFQTSASRASTGKTVGWACDGSVLAASGAHTELWSVPDWTPLGTLETPSWSSTVSFAAVGPLFAQTNHKGQVTIWRYDRRTAVATLLLAPSETMVVGHGPPCLAFHPARPILAAIDSNGVYLWDFDVDALLDAPHSDTVHYANAKVVMVGDSGVGKSALGLVLTGGEFRPTESTHGRHVWTLSSETRPEGGGAVTHRETLLWDLAGQPGYRVFHRQHLDEVAVALVLYDAHSETDPFAGVSYWARALDNATRDFPVKKFLVASRIDRGGPRASEARVREIAERHGFARSFETSAKRGDGVATLAAAIRAAIAWERLPTVSALKLFHDMKSFVLAEKLGGRVVQRRGELRERFCTLMNTDVAHDSFDICVGRLEAAGLVKRLSFGDHVLLQPEMLDDYSAWMALAARQEPDGLGFLSERTARAGGFAMDHDRPMRDRAEEMLLLTATVEDVVGRGIALRQPTEQGEMLVFPSELRDDMPDDVPEYVRAVIFHFDGPVKSVYATLAVCLAHAPAFSRQRFYRDAAVFRSAAGETCGFRMDYPRPSDDAHGQLTVFFDAGASQPTKLTFLRYVNRQLELLAFASSLRRDDVYRCDCGYPDPVPPAAVAWRLQRGERTVICIGCGRHLPLGTLADQSTRLDGAVEQQIAASDAERERQRRLSVMTERQRGAEYDVFLCHNSQEKAEVKRLADRLRDQGVLPWLDEEQLIAGTSLVAALEDVLDRIPCAAVIVGPHALGAWHEREYHALVQRLLAWRADARHRLRVIPVLLPGAAEPPPFLRSLVHVDFRGAAGLDDRTQLTRLLHAILTARTPERVDPV